MATSDILSGGNIEPRGLEEEMRSAYLDYAMSVIVGRALPDVRDGLKPVHRRVLFSMSENGLQPNRPYSKCARIVGDVMGNYHPHGDSAIYDTLVRMAQDFSLRYPLVDGQGNFGSVDDDPAAAMRYTEARLAPIAREMLRDLDADTVNFQPNYDGNENEPTVLPARFPNLLVNGSSGIAVGMATNIPPHNLRETIAATIAFIDNPDIDTTGLMQHMKGPDFPTGGVILGLSGIRDAYETGRGRVRVLQAPLHGRRDLAQVVRRDLGGEADRDAVAAVDEQIREARRQHRRLLRPAVVVRHEVDGVLVDVPQQLGREAAEAGLGVPHRRRGIVVDRAEVALTVDEQVTQGEVLRHPDQGVVDRRVAVRVVFAHHLADDEGALAIRPGRLQADVVHRVEHPPVHRLEAVAHVRQRPPDDDAHRVIEVGMPHFGFEADRQGFFGELLHGGR